MHRRLRHFVLIPVCLALAMLLCQSVAMACPTCKEGLAASDPARANMVRGYFWSILFMMSMPFLILGGLSAYFYLAVRRARSEQQQGLVGESATGALATADSAASY